MADTRTATPARNQGLVGLPPVSMDPKIGDDVLDATFITHTIPDIISPNACIIGLCTVSNERAGSSDQGWHISDFLAFKALLCGETHPKAQTWLAYCDIQSIVNASPEQYAHGKDRRLVNGAADVSTYRDRKGNLQRRDDLIKVEPTVEGLATEFVKTLVEKSEIVKKMGVPIIIIICGPTTLEQDVFLGETEAGCRVTSERMRQALGDDVDAIVVTPALFSSGWQVNPSFCRMPTTKVRADRTEFLARQFGGVFAKGIIEGWLGWKCPFLDLNLVDGKDKNNTLYPGPALPSSQQKAAAKALRVKIHSALMGRLANQHHDHSFDFDPQNDDWEIMVGPRKYKPLSYYRQKWATLRVGTSPATERQGLEFLGNAFGGTRLSQVNHIKHLVKESLTAWSWYWSLPVGQEARLIFKSFLDNLSPQDLDFHEVFDILEHRATLAVLADATSRYFGFPRPYKQRCRDWDEQKWTKESSDSIRLEVIQFSGELTRLIPGVNMPPGINYNHLSKIQSRLLVPISYLAVSFCSLYPTKKDPQKLKSISNFLERIRVRQVQILLKDPEVQALCISWLSSIQMPIRQPNAVLAAMASTPKTAQVSSASTSQPLSTITNTPAAATSVRQPGESIPPHLRGTPANTNTSRRPRPYGSPHRPEW
ncbi:hypothetical protein F5Y04DRAFT_290573 [Hypomontagnella monticulosa]|nr:hypothetical protein F5Y04DRAFT_290573 [Hypomontagnella monticulosa]